MMSEASKLQFLFSLEQTVLHELAKFCWGKFVLKEDINEESSCSCRMFFLDTVKCICKRQQKLFSYRDEVVSTVSRTLKSLPKASSLTLPQIIIDKVINAVFNLYEEYNEALEWEKNFGSSLPFAIFNPFTSDNYYAGNYIDANRHFNDIEWAKRFVADKDQFIQTRFEFACFYCFEENIIDLWETMKRKKQLPCKGNLHCIRDSYSPLVAIWAFNLEGKFRILVEEIRDEYYDAGFCFAGLIEAIGLNCAYAAQFFWNHCLETERAKFYSMLDDINILIDDSVSASMCSFIYSILSQEQIVNLIHQSFVMYRTPFLLWSHLIHSRFYKSVLEDILNFSLSVPLEVYGKLLDLLAKEILEKQIPIHKCIFEKIWNHLSNEQQIGILEMEERKLISSLTKLKFN